jgi:hypothetical protein
VACFSPGPWSTPAPGSGAARPAPTSQVFFCIFSRSSLSAGVYGATKDLLNVIVFKKIYINIYSVYSRPAPVHAPRQSGVGRIGRHRLPPRDPPCPTQCPVCLRPHCRKPRGLRATRRKRAPGAPRRPRGSRRGRGPRPARSRGPAPCPARARGRASAEDDHAFGIIHSGSESFEPLEIFQSEYMFRSQISPNA